MGLGSGCEISSFFKELEAQKLVLEKWSLMIFNKDVNTFPCLKNKKQKSGLSINDAGNDWIFKCQKRTPSSYHTQKLTQEVFHTWALVAQWWRILPLRETWIWSLSQGRSLEENDKLLQYYLPRKRTEETAGYSPLD